MTCGYKDKAGYFVTCLMDAAKKRIGVKIHRLVAAAFLPNYENKNTVDHIDRNRGNNYVLNLRWATSAEQNKNVTRNPTRGNGRKIYQYDLNGNILKLWNSLTEASKELGIYCSDIASCCRNKLKTAGKYIWKYYDEINGDMSGEIWVEIPLFNWQHHLVSNMGRVKQKIGKVLNETTMPSGYIKISIFINNKIISELAHRLVAYSFLGYNGNGNLVINHKNSTKYDNHLENLEIVTHRENIIHAVSNGSHTIKVTQMDLNNNEIYTYNSIKEASARNSISASSITQTCRGKQKTGGGYKWKYAC